MKKAKKNEGYYMVIEGLSQRDSTWVPDLDNFDAQVILATSVEDAIKKYFEDNVVENDYKQTLFVLSFKDLEKHTYEVAATNSVTIKKV